MKWYLQTFFTVLWMILVSATLHACPGCGADVASNSTLSAGFTYATIALIAVPFIAAIAVWRSIRRAISSASRAGKERNVTSFYDPDQG